jgi:hypothetical protein
MFQMEIIYSNIVHSKALQNMPKLEFLGMKINHLATLRAILNFTPGPQG